MCVCVCVCITNKLSKIGLIFILKISYLLEVVAVITITSSSKYDKLIQFRYSLRKSAFSESSNTMEYFAIKIARRENSLAQNSHPKRPRSDSSFNKRSPLLPQHSKYSTQQCQEKREEEKNEERTDRAEGETIHPNLGT